MSRKPDGSEPVNPQLGFGHDTQEPEGNGAGSDVADLETVQGNHDRRRIVRGVNSAIRSSRSSPEFLPVRPELRRLRVIVSYWPLVFPVALLVATIAVTILSHYVPVDRFDQAVKRAVTPTGNLTYPWGFLGYISPIFPLAGFWLLVGFVKLLHVWFAMTAPRQLAAVGPVVCLLTASGLSAFVLIAGAKLQPPAHVVLLTISVYVLLAALSVNWVVSLVFGMAYHKRDGSQAG